MSHIPTPVAVGEGGTGASSASTARTNLGLGTIATQDANNVSISGGSIATSALGSGTANSSTYLRGDQSWQNPVAAAWPVGSIFISTSSTNPGTSLGVGTWTSFGAGRVLVGLDAGQTEFDTVEETGGSKTVTLSTSEIPAHNHGVTDPGHTHTQNAHTHTVSVSLSDPGHNHTQNAHGHTITITDPGHYHAVGREGSSSTFGGDGNGPTYDPYTRTEQSGTSTTGISASASSTTATNNSATTGITVSSASAGNTTATNNSATTGITTNNAGGGGAHTNLQPYIVVYMFKRVA